MSDLGPLGPKLSGKPRTVKREGQVVTLAKPKRLPIPSLKTWAAIGDNNSPTTLCHAPRMTGEHPSRKPRAKRTGKGKQFTFLNGLLAGMYERNPQLGMMSLTHRGSVIQIVVIYPVEHSRSV